MSDVKPRGWLLTIPDKTIRYTKVLEILLQDLKEPVMMDNTIIPNALCITGTHEAPDLGKYGFRVLSGTAPLDHEETADPHDVWLFTGEATEIQWPWNKA